MSRHSDRHAALARREAVALAVELRFGEDRLDHARASAIKRRTGRLCQDAAHERVKAAAPSLAPTTAGRPTEQPTAWPAGLPALLPAGEGSSERSSRALGPGAVCCRH